MEVVFCLLMFMLVVLLLAILLKFDELVEQFKIRNNLNIDAKQEMDSILDKLLVELELPPKGEQTYQEYMENQLKSFHEPELGQGASIDRLTYNEFCDYVEKMRKEFYRKNPAKSVNAKNLIKPENSTVEVSNGNK